MSLHLLAYFSLAQQYHAQTTLRFRTPVTPVSETLEPLLTGMNLTSPYSELSPDMELIHIRANVKADIL